MIINDDFIEKFGFELVIPIILSYLGYRFKIFYDTKIHNKEKNTYIHFLKTNDHIRETYFSLSKISATRFVQFVYIYLGLLLSLSYFKLLVYATDTILAIIKYFDSIPLMNDLLLYCTRDITSVDKFWIVSLYLLLAITPLFIVALFVCKYKIKHYLRDGTQTISYEVLIFHFIGSTLFGLIIGCNIIINLLIYYLILIDLGFESITSTLLYEKIGYLIAFYRGDSDTIIIIGVLISFLICMIIQNKMKKLLDNINTRIINFRINEYPYVIIKKESEEIKGNIKNIFDSKLIELSDSNSTKVTSWKNITTIEMTEHHEDKKPEYIW
ncbi:hypothetical protein V7O61_03000 [Methanolobus sp. WCC1]|uniref:hypothetical protein n=1 Tax=unclassified Methanolobus TaxID=2629569 RepID=UPI0032560813